ncbi:site-specific recombinase XerD [Streptomyces sp. Ag82_O1-15]|uniref:tyrosine-type recombinase/integrase n=1 Tax=Streptomyces sp. Ag82_O1-15 TaxID=1938855 RepID=UPI000BD85007|nr:tyrosine-type recombinase/integrase [Streptomyces sp. Ag82_O1-15]PBC96163.1 site-specific recombinase XerD [Streptomyces sp. Ag82_O1-15]PBC96185.1 site-specific recombinase XerD [Streptomyces sp. Ag82_O1-15]
MSTTNDTPAGRPRGSARPGYSLDIRLWKVTKTGRKSRPYRLRWVVAGQVHGDTFATSALADSRRSELWQAMRRGEAFGVESGLPESEVRAAAEAADAKPPLRWFEFCRKYVAGRWRTGAAKTREGMADGLAAVTLAMVKRADGVPEDASLRLAFRWGVVPANAGEDPPAELKTAYEWIATMDRPLVDLADAEVFEDVLYRLSYKLDGTPAAVDTYKRRRRALNTALEHAVAVGELPENPLQHVRRKHVGSNDVVDRRVLVNAVQARQLLTAVSYVGSWDRCRGRRLVAFYAVLYYAGLRTAEVVGLRLSDCHLPETGWGRLTLRETRPVSGKQWTDSGERHDRRGLKAREASADRPVPIPPVLVTILQTHLKDFGTAKEGRVFGNERGGLVGSSTYWRVWEEAREYALPPDRIASPLAGRPYDLRHACITRWLNAGVPIAEVARRVGNSPEVIHRRYHGCIDGHEEAANAKIAKSLNEEGDMA